MRMGFGGLGWLCLIGRVALGFGGVRGEESVERRVG